MAKVFNIGGNTISYGGFLLRELGSGSLTISKTVSGSGFDPTKTFELTVVFSVPVTYNGTTSTTHTFNLAHGQSVTITDIPELTTYEVTETPLSQQDIEAGYSVSGITGGSGSIAVNGVYTAAALNTYRNKATLTLRKIIQGTGYDPSKTFEVVVTFGSAILYTVNGVSIETPSATYTGNLTHGQSVVLGNIPDGTTYSVAESPLSQADIDAGYRFIDITNPAGTAEWNGNYSSLVNNYFHTVGGTIRFKFEDTSYDPTALTYGETWNPNFWTNLGNGVWEYTKNSGDWYCEFQCGVHPNKWGTYRGKFSVIYADLGGVYNAANLFNNANLTASVLFAVSHMEFASAMFKDTLVTNLPAFDATGCYAIDSMFAYSDLTTAALQALWNVNKRRDDGGGHPSAVFKGVNSTYLHQLPSCFGGDLDRAVIYEGHCSVGTEFTIKCDDYIRCQWSSGGSAGSHSTTFTRISGEPMFGETTNTITITNSDLSVYGSRTAGWRWAKYGVYRLTSGAPQSIRHSRYPIDLGV